MHHTSSQVDSTSEATPKRQRMVPSNIQVETPEVRVAEGIDDNDFLDDMSDEDDYDYGAPSCRSSGGSGISLQHGNTVGDTTAASEAPNNQFRQKQRTVRACDVCRKKRVKCSGQSPCKLCGSKGFDCVYSPLQVRERPLKNSAVSKTGGVGSVTNNPLQRFDSLEHRLGVVERILGRLFPDTDESNLYGPLKAIREQLHQEMKIEALSTKQDLHPDAGSSASKQPLAVTNATNQIPDVPQVGSVSIASLAFKTGGFLTNADESLFSFWGSTSALGGTTNQAHIYKSIPRFENGVLRVHTPSKEYLVQHNVTQFLKPKTLDDESISAQALIGPGPVSEAIEQEKEQSVASTPPEFLSKTIDPTKIEVLPRKKVPQDMKTVQELIPLPDDLVDHILANYWEQFHPQFPLLEKQWFLNELTNLRRVASISDTKCINVEEHWRFILVLTSVIALMLNFTPSLTQWKSTPTTTEPQSPPSKDTFRDHDTVLQHLVEFFRRILFGHFESPHIYVVQSLLIMVLTGGCQRGFRVTGTWGFMGMAIRMAQELGLHRSISELGVSHKKLDSHTIGIRNLTWHCVMIMETYTCIWTGRPYGINDNDWDAECPTVSSPELATLQYHIDLAQIIASILRFGNRARQVDVQSTVTGIANRLDSWWKGLDNDWKTFNFAERWNSKALMALMYHGAIILFHRMAFNRLDHPTCVTAAAAITTLISRLERPVTENECLALFPTVTYCAMMSCTVHLSQLLLTTATSSSNTPSTSSNAVITAVENLEKCLRVFDSLRSVFVDAETCSKTVLDFLTVKGIRLEDLAEAAQKSMQVSSSDAIVSSTFLHTSSSSAVVPSSGATSTQAGAGQQQYKRNSSNSVQVATASDGKQAANGFFTDILNRTSSMKRKQPGSGRVNSTLPKSPRTSVNQLRNTSVTSNSASPVAGNNRSGGQSFGSTIPAVIGSSSDIELMWDGMSLFDLAAFGGLANTDATLMGGQQQSNLFQSIQPIQHFNQQPQRSQQQQQFLISQQPMPQMQQQLPHQLQLQQQQQQQQQNQIQPHRIQPNQFAFPHQQQQQANIIGQFSSMPMFSQNQMGQPHQFQNMMQPQFQPIQQQFYQKQTSIQISHSDSSNSSIILGTGGTAPYRAVYRGGQ
ncbi:UNVERIFIED_CONTAM: hypothetical protein HDU68_009510 [Siphonaria sp. JEL0065]|nr:hypothetical protein HDU68_009510 [Siphonaria sp. JEL0065]